MTTKQLTGMITIDTLNPDEWELTGEYRHPRMGEWFISNTGSALQLQGTYDGFGYRAILRRKPRKIRVTPTQADLDAAPSPIKCWVWDSMGNDWLERKLYAIDKFNGWFYTGSGRHWGKCEIEKEVTE